MPNPFAPVDVGADVGPLLSQHLWVIFLVMLALFMAAHEVGYQFRRWRDKRHPDEPPADRVGGYLPAALGLMGLLVGFTFGMSYERYNARRTLLGDEAAAIATHYRRIQTIEEPFRTQLAGGLVDYLGVRIADAEARTRPDVIRTRALSEQAESRLWRDVVAAVAKSKASQAPALLASGNDVLKAADQRLWAEQARVPVTIMRTVVAYALIAAAFTGYALKPGRRFLAASTLQFALLAAAMTMIVDLNRPRAGLIAVRQTPLLDTADPPRRGGVPAATLNKISGLQRSASPASPTVTG